MPMQTREQQDLLPAETKAKFEAREQSEDEQFIDYENNHGWDIIIYNNWDIDTAVKTMLDYVRPIMTPVIEASETG